MIISRARCCQYCLKASSTSHCARCKMVHYCSRKCQVKDWPEHKHICNDETAKIAVVSSKLFDEISAIDRLQLILASYLTYRTKGDPTAGYLKLIVKRQSVDSDDHKRYILICVYCDGNPRENCQNNLSYNIQLIYLADNSHMSRWTGLTAENSDMNMDLLHELYKNINLVGLTVETSPAVEPKIVLHYKDQDDVVRNREVV